MAGNYRVNSIKHWLSDCISGKESYPYVFHVDEYKNFTNSESKQNQALKIYNEVFIALKRSDIANEYFVLLVMNLSPVVSRVFNPISNSNFSEEPSLIYVLRNEERILPESVSCIEPVNIESNFLNNGEKSYFVELNYDGESCEKCLYIGCQLGFQ